MTGEWQAFAEWCVLDCLWPEDRGTQERLDFLKARGCRILTADAFGISAALAHAESVAMPRAVVLSNLNWRGRQRELATKNCGTLEQSYNTYNRLLIQVLRLEAPGAHIVVLARNSDGVIAGLNKSRASWLVQALHRECVHAPIQSTAHSEVFAVPVPITHGGGQMVGVSLAAGCSIEAGIVSADGFHLYEFLASVSGPLWFIGEGDASLAYACARHTLMKTSPPVERNVPVVTLVESTAPVDKRESALFPSFGELRNCVQQCREFSRKEPWEQNFVAALYWEIFADVTSEKCECGRCIAPESWSHCCRTGESSKCEHHGRVCSERYDALETLRLRDATASSSCSGASR